MCWRGEGVYIWRLISDDELMFEMVICFVVSNDWLFLMYWVWQFDFVFWMYEIIDGLFCEEGFWIIIVDLVEGLFDEWWYNFIFVVLIFYCDGFCSCVVFVLKWLGRVWIYDLVRQIVDFFFVDLVLENCYYVYYYFKFMCYWGMYMYLNLRNMLLWYVEDCSIYLEYYCNEFEFDFEKYVVNLLRLKSIWFEYY